MNIISKVETPEADKYKEISKSLHAELVLLMRKAESHFFFRMRLLHKKSRHLQR